MWISAPGEQAAVSRTPRKPRIVGIGGGVASAAAVAELRKEGFDGDITLVSAEDTVPYERPPLSKEFLLGRSGSVPVKDPAWYQQNAVELLLSVRATRLDLAARTVHLSDGSVVPYDQLLLATGVRPRALPGIDGEGVCYLRTVQDATELRDRINAARHVAVLGGGFIGCEVASAAIQLGKRATILEALPTLLYRALGPDLGQVVAGIHRDAGVDVRTGQPVTGLTRGPGGGVLVTVGDDQVDADVLVVGVGTVPNQELAEQAGLPVGNGIEVDEHFATAVPGVWAVGDVVAQHLPRYGRRVRVEHHDTALRHGRAVARNMLGRPEPFGDVHWFWSDQFEHTISSAGLPDTDGPLIIRGSLEQRSFSAFSLDGERLSAVISLNRPKDVLDVRKLIAREHRATADQLRDESLPLKRLAPSAATAPSAASTPSAATVPSAPTTPSAASAPSARTAP
jgi:3-phenylpropionate/trans-cinnamate dioxygenase ferredoxin reductase subunit